MEDLISYVRLRADIAFTDRPFNPVDALVFSELAYVDWDGIVKETPIPLQEACKMYCTRRDEAHIQNQFAFSLRIPQLVKELCAPSRFSSVMLKRYQSVFDEEQEIQFAAVTFVLPNGARFAAYRGTDSTMVGWKENMKMTYQDEIPCQRLAWEYLCRLAREECASASRRSFFHKRKETPLYLGGHSKGGNLAMYAAIRERSLHARITQVFNFDGPGFRPGFYAKYETQDILPKICTYLPESTVIGRLLEHRERHVILEGNNSGLLQHDAFCWSIGAQDFHYLETWDAESDAIQETIDRILMRKDDAQRKSYIDLVFRVIDRLDVKTLSDIGSLSFRQGFNGMLELRGISGEERKFLLDIVNFLWSQTRSLLFTLHDKKHGG